MINSDSENNNVKRQADSSISPVDPNAQHLTAGTSRSGVVRARKTGEILNNDVAGNANISNVSSHSRAQMNSIVNKEREYTPREGRQMVGVDTGPNSYASRLALSKGMDNAQQDSRQTQGHFSSHHSSGSRPSATNNRSGARGAATQRPSAGSGTRSSANIDSRTSAAGNRPSAIKTNAKRTSVSSAADRSKASPSNQSSTQIPKKRLNLKLIVIIAIAIIFIVGLIVLLTGGDKDDGVKVTGSDNATSSSGIVTSGSNSKSAANDNILGSMSSSAVEAIQSVKGPFTLKVVVLEGETTWLDIQVDGTYVVSGTISGPKTYIEEVKEKCIVSCGSYGTINVYCNGSQVTMENNDGLGYIALEIDDSEESE